MKRGPFINDNHACIAVNTDRRAEHKTLQPMDTSQIRQQSGRVNVNRNDLQRIVRAIIGPEMAAQ
ncbi:hypothetical protein FHS21_004584 [Phyllobacterium trifolii]|uniref:Uncharacterized protein n=1 Tax=Phyllobacterium trifolii TaxID=300193 RepID=A0A839UHL3_9HYPH|nr:hypothetical protein [Phyllobacterium trifolii]